MTASKLLLGDFEFQDFEVPSEITFGGIQEIKRHVFVGPKKALDVMGPDEDPVEWSGRFRGPDALERARRLDAMRKLGLEYALTWEGLSYTVVIGRFTFKPATAREVPYTIVCEVVRDDGSPPPAAAPVGITEMVKSDLSTSQQLQALLDEAELDEQMDSLADAVGGVRDFATASRSTLNGVLGPVFAVQRTVSGLISSAETVLTSVQALGGVVPGLGGRDLSAGLLRQVVAMGDVANLYDLEGFVGRMETNVSAIATSGSRITVAGADLFGLAQMAYGDATRWDTIARANGLTDPVLAGVLEIVIPPTPADTGGVL